MQKVYQAAMRIWHLALGLSLLAGLALAWQVGTRPAFFATLQWVGLLTAGLIAAIGILAVLAWQVWFVAFHQVFFAPGTWSFNTMEQNSSSTTDVTSQFRNPTLAWVLLAAVVLGLLVIFVFKVAVGTVLTYGFLDLMILSHFFMHGGPSSHGAHQPG